MRRGGQAPVHGTTSRSIVRRLRARAWFLCLAARSLRQELGSMSLCLRRRLAAEHASELVLARRAGELADVGLGPPGELGLLDVKVMIGVRRDLRQVGD